MAAHGRRERADDLGDDTTKNQMHGHWLFSIRIIGFPGRRSSESPRPSRYPFSLSVSLLHSLLLRTVRPRLPCLRRRCRLLRRASLAAVAAATAAAATAPRLGGMGAGEKGRKNFEKKIQFRCHGDRRALTLIKIPRTSHLRRHCHRCRCPLILFHRLVLRPLRSPLLPSPALPATGTMPSLSQFLRLCRRAPRAYLFVLRVSVCVFVCICVRWVLCVASVRGYKGGFGGTGRKARGFSLTHIEGEEGPSGRTTRQPPVRSFARWWRVVCLFVSRERASGGYRKKFYLHDRKMFPVRKSERSRGPEEDAASRPLSLHPPRTSSLAAEQFYLFSAPRRAKAREGVAKSSVGRRLKSGGGF